MRPDDLDDGLPHVAGLGHFGTEECVLADDRELRRCQWPVFLEERGRNADLPDIVQNSPDLEVLEGFGGEVQHRAEGSRQGCHGLHVRVHKLPRNQASGMNSHYRLTGCGGHAGFSLNLPRPKGRGFRGGTAAASPRFSRRRSTATASWASALAATPSVAGDPL